MGIFSFLKNKNKDSQEPLPVLKTDMHSHLIFDVDDGAKTLEDSVQLIRHLQKMGYEKLITSPHIMGDFYKNSAENLLPKLEIIREELLRQNIDVELDCAAEYYLDEFFISKLKKREPLLTFGDNYVLFETSFMTKPNQLYEVIFDLLSNGYKPVFAHPERYIYLHGSLDQYMEIKEKGVFFQLNLNSLTGYYSKEVKKAAEKLIDQKMVDFLGTDCHNMKHVGVLKRSREEKYYGKALRLPLINKEIL